VHTHKWMFTSLLSNNNKPSQLRKAICPLWTEAATAGWRIEGSRVLKLEVMVEHETEYKLEVEIHLGVTYCDTLEELWIEDWNFGATYFLHSRVIPYSYFMNSISIFVFFFYYE
jgi:hypothetical protein